MKVEEHAEVVVDEVDVPLGRNGNRLRHARERIHVFDGHRDVERHEKRPDVRLTGLAARLGAEALLVEVEAGGTANRHRPVDVGPVYVDIPGLETSAARPDRRDDLLGRDAEDVGAHESEREGRHGGQLRLKAPVALKVPGKIVSVVQPRDSQPHDAHAPEEDVDGSAVGADYGLDGVRALAVVEPDAAHARAAAEAERRRVALEDDVGRHAGGHCGDDPVGRDALFAEEETPHKYAKDDEGPLHRLVQKYRRFLHCRRRSDATLAMSCVAAPRRVELLLPG